MDDIRLKELAFLQRIASWTHNGQQKYFLVSDPEIRSIGLDQQYLIEMVILLLEDGSLIFREDHMQRLVARLRHEYVSTRESIVPSHEWENPRQTLRMKFLGSQAFTLAITYTGLRQIEELRERLKADRILDSLGVLLDWRYFHPELRITLGRDDVTAISVIALDLDNFKRINDEYGHDPGDEVLRGYMKVVKAAVGTFGTAFRRGGDEVRVLLPGFDSERGQKLAESIRLGVESMVVQFKETKLPGVTTSIGVATSPSDPRDAELDFIADQRQKSAKKAGKNRVVSQ